MKPTEKQKKAINLLIDQLKCWRDSNDIDSPSPNTYMEECFTECFEEMEIDYTYLSAFMHKINNIFLFIKCLK